MAAAAVQMKGGLFYSLETAVRAGETDVIQDPLIQILIFRRGCGEKDQFPGKDLNQKI